MQMSRCCLQAVVGYTGLWGHEFMMPAGIFREMETQCDNLQDPACPVHHPSFPLSPQRLLGGGRAALDPPAPNSSLCCCTWDGAGFL